MRRTGQVVLLTGLLSVCAVTAASAPQHDKQPDPKAIIVPFELLSTGHMAVQVKVNGKGPYRLIFDTGAPPNLVNNKLAAEAGILKKDPKMANPGVGLFGLAGAKTIDTLEVGQAKLDKVPVMVMDHPTVTAAAKALGPIDGIIGFPFFARYATTIDYHKKELTLVPNGYVPSDTMQMLMDKLMKGQRGKPEPRVVAPAGLWGITVTKAANDEEAGVTIDHVLPNSPAAEGGLKAGDRLLTVDGRWTDSVNDTYLAASVVKPGRAVEVVVLRDGQEVKLTVKPAKGF